MTEGKPPHLENRFRGPGTPKLMLVDDDDMMRRSSERFLKRAGFDVTSAASGPEALEMLDEGALVDVFVVDLEMPEMNGIELMRRLAKIAPNTPRGLWSASQELESLADADLALAWFVKAKTRPIGELVQAACHAVYGQKTPVDAEGEPDDGEGEGEDRERRQTRSGWMRRRDILDDVDDHLESRGLNRESSSR